MLGFSDSLSIVILKETAVSILDESRFVTVKYDSLFVIPFLQTSSFPRGVSPISKEKWASFYCWLVAAKNFIKTADHGIIGRLEERVFILTDIESFLYRFIYIT